MTAARTARRRRLVVGAVSVAGHLAVLFAVLPAREPREIVPDAEPMAVQLVTPPAPKAPAPEPRTPDPPPPAARTPVPAKPTPAHRHLARAVRAPPQAQAPPAGEAGATDEAGAGLTDSQLASAVDAGSGRAGGACNMARRLQEALRSDQRVQAAVADAHAALGSGGRPLLVWNGGWVRSHGQDGAGLAAVREAILWEVGFAPPACRAEAVHGLVLISLADGPGAGRLVLGGGDWRWSDVLRARSAD